MGFFSLMDFSLIQETTRNADRKHLLYKNHFSLYNKVVQAILQENDFMA